LFIFYEFMSLFCFPCFVESFWSIIVMLLTIVWKTITSRIWFRSTFRFHTLPMIQKCHSFSLKGSSYVKLSESSLFFLPFCMEEMFCDLILYGLWFVSLTIFTFLVTCFSYIKEGLLKVCNWLYSCFFLPARSIQYVFPNPSDALSLFCTSLTFTILYACTFLQHLLWKTIFGYNSSNVVFIYFQVIFNISKFEHFCFFFVFFLDILHFHHITTMP